MLKRVLTGVVGLPIVLFLIYTGGLPLIIACGLLALGGLRELYTAFSKGDKPIHVVGYIFTIVYFTSIHFFDAGYWLLISLTFFIITTQTCLVVFFQKLTLQECVNVVYGFLYVPFLMSFIVLVREHNLGQYYVWLIFTSAFGADTFAFLAGSFFGKHKLKNTPSPSKSVEGVIGGILGAGLVGLIYGFFMSRYADPEATQYMMLNATVISLIGAVFSIIGDMAASAIKRRTDIKDFGHILPGHGGVLDRVDSVIIVAPVVYLVMNVMIWLLIY